MGDGYERLERSSITSTNALKESILDENEFGVTCEHVLGREARERQGDAVFEDLDVQFP